MKALQYTKGIRSEFEIVKQGAAHLQAFDGELKQVFTKVEKVYFKENKNSAY